MAQSTKRIEASDPAMVSKSKDELLDMRDRRAAADELFRRAFNKRLTKQAA